MDHQTDHAAAVAAIETAEATGNVAAATIVFDALDAHHDALTAMDRYDFALSTWNRLVDNELPITDDDIVALAVRVATHLPEHAVVDLIDARFGGQEKRIRLDDGRGLVWLPEDHLVILSAPVPGGVVDAVLGRPVRRTA